MFDEYKDREKRKKYLKEYRIKNRKRIYQQHKEWLKKTVKRYYIPKGEKTEKYYGTTGLGRKYEKLALKILKGAVDCNKISINGKWDIEWNGYKIDVKMRNLNKRNSWGFTTKPNPRADYYLLFCVRNDEIVKILFVPKSIFKTSLNVKNNSKYDKYRLFF